MPDPLSQMPNQIRLGDTLEVLFDFSTNFPASDGWVVTIFFIGITADYSKPTTASGDNHLLSISAVETDLNLKVEQMAWQAKAVKATEYFKTVFQKKKLPSKMPKYTLAQKKAILLPQLMMKLGLIKSKSEGKRLIEQGGVKINQRKVKNTQYKIDPKKQKEIILQVGPRRFAKIRFKS